MGGFRPTQVGIDFLQEEMSVQVHILWNGHMCSSRNAETRYQTYQQLWTMLEGELVTGALSLSAS